MENRLSNLQASSLNAAEKTTLVDLSMEVLKSDHARGKPISSPEQTTAFLMLKTADYFNEVFGAIFLDNQNRVLTVADLFYGTINGAAVYPRVVVQRALENNAAAVIFFHNHPSGVCEPSREDERITKRLIDALALVDVRVLDHLIVAAGESMSFAKRGLL